MMEKMWFKHNYLIIGENKFAISCTSSREELLLRKDPPMLLIALENCDIESEKEFEPRFGIVP